MRLVWKPALVGLLCSLTIALALSVLLGRLARRRRAIRQICDTSTRTEGNPVVTTRAAPGPVRRVFLQSLAQGYFSQLDETDLAQDLDLFAHENGEITDTHFCVGIPAAAILTKVEQMYGPPTYVLHLTFPPRTASRPWITELLLELNRLHLEVRQFVRIAKDQQLCMSIIFMLVVQLLRLMEADALELEHVRVNGPSSAASSPLDRQDDEATRRVYGAQVDQARRFYENVVQRGAQGRYFLGMFVGAALLAALAVGGSYMSTTATQLFQNYRDIVLILTSLVVGGVGAVVSVMQRMTRGDFQLQGSAGSLALLLVGGFRPLLGGVIAVVIFAVLSSGLIPVKTPEQLGLTDAASVPSNQWYYFFVAIAFFAGFSERFAQDTLARAESTLAVTTSGSATR